MTDREAASAIIDRFNGHSIEGSSAPLQVRFADSPAQKKLKNQTARKRMIRPTTRDFQPMPSFSMRPMMPITPETMLGIAPSSHYYPDPSMLQYHPIVTQQQQPPPQPASSVTEGLVQDMEKKMTLAES